MTHERDRLRVNPGPDEIRMLLRRRLMRLPAAVLLAALAAAGLLGCGSDDNPLPFIGGENAPTLTIVKDGTGSGTVTSDVEGIDCGGTCSADYAKDDVVVLTATPEGGSVFTGWSGGGCSGTGTCTVTMSSSATVTATFDQVMHTLIVVYGVLSDTPGAIDINPPGLEYDVPCSVSFPAGTVVQLTPLNSYGAIFDGWGDGVCTINGNICTVTMNANIVVTASFIH